jgi:hypothetical protein
MPLPTLHLLRSATEAKAEEVKEEDEGLAIDETQIIQW